MTTEITIRRYRSRDAGQWDSFVAQSRNALFLFRRGYMDYHADRFRDHSLMAYRNGRLAALLPANETGENADKTLQSHGGLTFGGWLLPIAHFDADDMLILMQQLLKYCRQNNFTKIIYKPIPFIYTSIPSQEDVYALWRVGAKLTECHLSTAIRLADNPGYSTLMRRQLKAARQNTHLHFSEEGIESLPQFYNLLEQCLRQRHNATPVHNCAELQLLMHRFPQNIRIFQVKDESPADDSQLPLAAVMLYISRQTAHCQYIATSPEGRENHALPYLFAELIAFLSTSPENSHIQYFDFGTSNEARGTILNSGLARQKYALGGRAVTQLTFTIHVDNSNAGI